MNVSKILVIDDSKTFLMYITQLFTELGGINVKTLSDPREALAVATEFLPEVILTDFEMPHLNGLQLCTLFKKNPDLSLIPIMMLTSMNTEDSLIKAIQSGADDYLYKGSKKEVVLIKVMGLLRHKKLVEADIKLKQLEAVKALVATTNHEFNNALFISNGYLRKMQKNADDENSEILEKVKEMNSRMKSLVQKLEELKDISISDSEESLKNQMLKF